MTTALARSRCFTSTYKIVLLQIKPGK